VSGRVKFISFEGTEACGKSTQLDLLRQRLEARGENVVVTREPGGTKLGEMLRSLLMHAEEGRGMADETELLLFAASRAQLRREVIEPGLAAGGWVLSDRYGDSTTVYQGVARKLPGDAVAAVNAFAMGTARPGLTLVFDLDLEIARQRLRDRLRRRPRPVGEVDRIEALPPEFFARVRDGYRALAAAEPERVRLVEAAGTVDQIAGKVWEMAQAAYGELLS
jgi:dTMP kinase